jgi:DNA-binding PucR family transcriptional regulator
MNSTQSPHQERLFARSGNTLTGVFRSYQAAQSAMHAVEKAGIGRHEANLLAVAPSRTSVPQWEDVTDAIDEVLKSFRESFSDDERLEAQLDRALASGGAVLNVSLLEREEERHDLSALLKQHGAFAVIYWGPFATEWL